MHSLPDIHLPDAQTRNLLQPLEVESVLRNLGGVNQCHLVRCNDGKRYVLKLRSTSQRTNAAANEAFGSLLMRGLGFPTPNYRSVSITDATLYYNNELLFREEVRFRPQLGLHFASEYFDNCSPSTFDDIPHTAISALHGPGFLIGISVFDIWASHVDRRQFLFNNSPTTHRVRILFIDNENLFGGHLWNRWTPVRANPFLKSIVQSSCSMRELQEHVEFFQAMMPTVLQKAIPCIPPSWCHHNILGLEQRLLERLACLPMLVDLRLCSQKRFSFS